MRTERYDIIIIGSGAGGGTMAYALADTPARILILERGDFVPQEDENWNPEAVWKHLRYQTSERWIDERGDEFRPYTHYNVGGNTKFWGSVLYRLRREDFQPLEHMEGVSPGWPIDYDTLAPYYERAERLYHVHGELGTDPTEPERGAFPYAPIPHSETDRGDRRAAARAGTAPVPAAARHSRRLRALQHLQLVRVQGAREERGRSLLRAPGDRAAECRPVDERLRRRLLTNPAGDRVEAVEVEIKGETVRVEAPLVVVSCGAVNSAALLLRSANDKHPTGSQIHRGSSGRRYMAHLATMMQGFHPFRKNAAVFQKTVAINDFYFRGPHTTYPLGQIQSQGRTHGVMAQTVVPQVPLKYYEWWVARGVDWLAMSEDLPDAGNRVTLDSKGRIQLRYRPNNLRAHRMLVKETRRILHRLGFWVVMTHSHGAKNTTHQCGTVVFGDNPRESVLDPYCRAHDVENLFVVDASFFPSSAAVNPALTIAAQALRVADHIRTADLKVGTTNAATSPSMHAYVVLTFRSARHTRRQQLKARSFSHAGITVSDFNKAVNFYWDVFGCPLVGVADTPPDRVRTFFGVAHDSPTCKIGWIRVPGGGVLEIFEFQPQQPPGPVPWNGVGLTHISFNVKNLQKWHDHLQAKGVEIVSKPERSPRGHSFFFVKRLRRQPDRVDGPGLHVSRAQLVRAARRMAVPARDVQEVLRSLKSRESRKSR